VGTERRHHDRMRLAASGPAMTAPPQNATSATMTILVATTPRAATLKGRNGTPSSTTHRGSDPAMRTTPTRVHLPRALEAASLRDAFWVMRNHG